MNQNRKIFAFLSLFRSEFPPKTNKNPTTIPCTVPAFVGFHTAAHEPRTREALLFLPLLRSEFRGKRTKETKKRKSRVITSTVPAPVLVLHFLTPSFDVKNGVDKPPFWQEVQERQEKRNAARAERLAAGGEDDRQEGSSEGAEAGAAAGGAQWGAASPPSHSHSSGGSGGKPKKPLGCNTCGLTFPDTVRIHLLLLFHGSRNDGMDYFFVFFPCFLCVP